MTIIDCEQLSPEWWAARRGIASASNFDKVLTAKTLKFSGQADDYICELIAEMVDQSPNYFTRLGRPISQAMQHGIDTEPEARRYYEMEKDTPTKRVGFIISSCGRFGCSPDGLVGEDGGLEIKCVQPKTQVEYLLAGTIPPEYLMQVHGSLIITGRQWWDFLSYNPLFPPLLVRVEPNKITDALRDGLELFHKRYTETAARFGIVPQPRKEAA